MSTPKQRIKIELEELEIRHEALTKFLSQPSKDIVAIVGDTQYELLEKQLVIMTQYRDILQQRLTLMGTVE